MIVRISGEDQYELADDDAGRLNELEKDVIAIVESGEDTGFDASYQALLDFVRDAGSPVG